MCRSERCQEKTKLWWWPTAGFVSTITQRSRADIEDAWQWVTSVAYQGMILYLASLLPRQSATRESQAQLVIWHLQPVCKFELSQKLHGVQDKIPAHVNFGSKQQIEQRTCQLERSLVSGKPQEQIEAIRTSMRWYRPQSSQYSSPTWYRNEEIAVLQDKGFDNWSIGNKHCTHTCGIWSICYKVTHSKLPTRWCSSMTTPSQREQLSANGDVRALLGAHHIYRRLL